MESPTELIELADELCSQIAEYGKPAVQTIAAALLAERLSATERAAKLCEQKAIEFLSPQYAYNQPLGSFCERFACEECAAAIRSQP